MDAGKAISAMLCEEGSICNYLESIGILTPSGKKVPLITCPTTAGTGSEATKNAVITQQKEYKKSLRHDNYIPDIALIDPQLCIGCPSSVTSASGMDAFTQLLESYLSTNSTAITDTLALEGISKLMSSIEKAVNNGDDLEARSNMSYAALLSGITLANAGLGVVHGFAQPLGSLFSMPHGMVCGTLMGAVNRISVERLRSENNRHVLEKYAKVAQLISPNKQHDEAIDDLLNYLDRLISQFKLSRLSDFGISEDDFPAIIKETGMKNHPVDLNYNDLQWILQNRL
jgi:alcohol dehydrogenase class IV